MLREALFRLSQEPHLHRFATTNAIAWKAASRFVAGTTLDGAIDVVHGINAAGMTATLDHLGENVRTEDEARKASEEYCAMLRAIADSGVQSNVSLKLTHMGLDLGESVACENTLRVVDGAAEYGNFVRIDMEGSEYIDRTLEVFFRLWKEHKNLGVVIQSYLYRSESDLERVIEAGARVRLVKGAYLEPPDVAFQTREEVDAAYVQLMQMLLSRGNYPAIATHDPRMIDATREFARRENIGRDRFEFQMLYGVRRDLQAELVRDGYNMRVYVPFGTEWYPYLMRRLAERPANMMFVAGSIANEALGRR